MPVYSEVSIEAAPSAAERLYLPREQRGKKAKPASGLSHTYTTDVYSMAEADWVYLQVTLVAYQIHPATIAELAALGPVGGPNARRWTIEGPLHHVPGDPGAETNCTMKLEIAHSMAATPGSAWRDYEAGRFRLRSAQARVTIVRPSAAYDFRICRFSLLATKVPAPQQVRNVAAGVQDVIPSGMCRSIVRDFRLPATSSLRIEDDAFLKIS